MFRFKVATLPTPSSSTGAMKGQRGMVTGWTGSTGTLVHAAIDFACRRFSACFGLLGIGQ
jgi:hypothetical protein